MYSRVTLLEIDTMRVDMDDAVDVFREDVLPGLREQPGFEGVAVLVTPEGKGMILTLWETEDEAAAAAGFAGDALARHVTLFRAPPGREQYAVAFADLPERALVA
jgi:heme-degrading monooxygenase HmoA